MKSAEELLTQPSQLNRLSLSPLSRTSGLGKLRLGGSLSGHPELNRWERDLNRHYYACGCDASAKGLILGLLAGGALAGCGYFSGTLEGAQALGLAFLSLVAGAILGKTHGLMRASRKLQETVGEIQKHWQPEEAREEGRGLCG